MGHAASRAGTVNVPPAVDRTDDDWDLDEPTQVISRPRRPRSADPLRTARAAFDALSRLPGYRGCLLIDSGVHRLLRADGTAITDPAFVGVEASLWIQAGGDPSCGPVEEVITVTPDGIQVARPAEPSGRLFFVVFCSKADANLGLVRLALRQATRWESTDKES